MSAYIFKMHTHKYTNTQTSISKFTRVVLQMMIFNTSYNLVPLSPLGYIFFFQHSSIFGKKKAFFNLSAREERGLNSRKTAKKEEGEANH